jgi:3-oxoacyl-[acyl-carrier protein] reductase
VVETLAADGLRRSLTYWTPYDARMPWGSREGDVADVVARAAAHGAATVAIEADLSDIATPRDVVARVEAELGRVSVLVLCHTESVDSDLFTTTPESLDLHYAVNVRASWLLIREYALRCPPDPGADGAPRRIVAMTSDQTVGNWRTRQQRHSGPHRRRRGSRARASRGVRQRRHPGATDTGWMSDEELARTADDVPLRRVGTPSDAAALVSFLCSQRAGGSTARCAQ